MSSTYEIADERTGEAAETGHAPLSFTQQQLWFAEQIDPDQSLYTEALAVRIRGSIDDDALDRALREVLRRHDALRTVFPLVDNQPVQQVLPPDTPLQIHRTSVADLPDTQRDTTLNELVTRFVEQPLDLTSELSTRALLISVSSDDHVLVFTLHHLVSDGLSGRIVFAELGQLYEAFSAGRPSPLPEPELQYIDFTEWERAVYDSGYLEDDIAYWRRQLAGVEPILELPARRRRPANKGVHGERSRYPLADATLHARIADFCREHAISLYALTLSVYSATVSHWARQHDLVFGTLAANRPRSELENVVGQLANTLPMRVDLSGDPSLPELLSRVARTSEEAIEHGLVSLGKIIELMTPRRDPSRNALIQHLFLMSGQPASTASWGSLSVAPFDVQRNRGRLDTIVEIAEESGELVTWVEYDTQLLDADEVARLMEQFAGVLREWLDTPSLRLSQLRLPDGGEIGPAPHTSDPEPAAETEVAAADGAVGRHGNSSGGPRDALQELLSELWCELLKVDSIAPDDDFFALGGHSMLSARLIERMRDALGIAVPLRMLFRHSGFADFTEAVRVSYPEVEDVVLALSQLSDDDAADLLRSLPAELAGEIADEPAAETVTRPAGPRRFPLTSSQLQIWMVEYLRGAQLTYTIPMEFHITGALEVEALRRSLQRIVQRHDALRVTVEVTDAGEPMQIVHDSIPFEVEFTDLTGAGDASAEQEIRRRIGYHEFVIDQGPLLAAHVVRKGPDRHTLYIVFHHMVMDERSMTLFMSELSELYAAELDGTAGPDQPRLQIGDYVQWERAQLRDDSLERLRAFWRSKLDGVSELVLPTDSPRPDTPTFTGEFLRRPQDRALFDDLAALAASQRVTPFIAFTAATALLLGRLSGQDRFVIGMPSDSRAMPGSEVMLGCFINVVPIRVDCSGAPTFAQFAQRLRDEVVAAYDHRALPLSAIVDAVGAARPANRLPLFQVATELQVEEWMPLQLRGCEVSFGFIGHGTARYDLAFHAMAKPDSFDVCVEVSNDVYEFETGYRWLDEICSLMRQAIANPHLGVAEYELGA
jgi:NRPS condensation-like uncharacterized protein